jgi:hypothetical protein
MLFVRIAFDCISLVGIAKELRSLFELSFCKDEFGAKTAVSSLFRLSSDSIWTNRKEKWQPKVTKQHVWCEERQGEWDRKWAG